MYKIEMLVTGEHGRKLKTVQGKEEKRKMQSGVFSIFPMVIKCLKIEVIYTLSLQFKINHHQQLGNDCPAFLRANSISLCIRYVKQETMESFAFSR